MASPPSEQDRPDIVSIVLMLVLEENVTAPSLPVPVLGAVEPERAPIFMPVAEVVPATAPIFIPVVLFAVAKEIFCPTRSWPLPLTLVDKSIFIPVAPVAVEEGTEIFNTSPLVWVVYISSMPPGVDV